MERTDGNGLKAALIGIAAWLIFLAGTGFYVFSGIYLKLVQSVYYFIPALFSLFLLVTVLTLIGRRRPPEFKAALCFVGALLWAVFLLVVVLHLNDRRLKLEATKEEIRELAQTGRNAIEAHKSIIERGTPEKQESLPQENQSSIPQSLPGNARRSTASRLSTPEIIRKINELFQEMSQRSVANHTKMASELKDLGLETIFLPETLTNLVGIEQNRGKIRTYRELVEQRTTDVRSDMVETEQRFTDLVAGFPEETDFLRGFANAKKIHLDFLNEMYANQGAAITAITGLNEFMASRLGRATARNGKVVFQTQEDVTQYNRYLTEIKKQAQIESDLRTRYLALLQKGLMNIDKMEEKAR